MSEIRESQRIPHQTADFDHRSVSVSNILKTESYYVGLNASWTGKHLKALINTSNHPRFRSVTTLNIPMRTMKIVGPVMDKS